MKGQRLFPVVLGLTFLLGGVGIAAGQQPPSVATPDQAGLKWEPCGDLPKGCEFSTLRFDEATKAWAGFVRAPAGYVFPLHSHAANEQLVWIKGEATARVGDGPEQPMRPGAYVFTPSKTPHAFRCDQPCQMYVFLDGADKITLHQASGQK
jgi:quercetin dioxygenase-like cupin family protein